MALLLFGPQYADWVSKGVSLYETVKPMLSKQESASEEPAAQTPARGKGIDIRFQEHTPIPDVLVRIARVTLLLDAGELKGEIVDIASDQTIYGKPVTFRFAGQKLKAINGVSVQGTIDRTRINQAVDTVTGRIDGYQIADIALSKDSSLPISLERASADIDLDIHIRNQQIASRVTSNLHSVVFDTGKTGEKDLLRAAMQDALEGVSKFQVKAALTGTLEQNDITVESDIDKVMGTAVTKAVAKQVQLFEQKLKEQITQKTNGMLGGLDSSIGDLQFIDKELTDRLKFGDGLLGDTKLF